MRIYISGPLQGAQNLAQARRFYELLAAAVEAAGSEAYVPHLATDPVHSGHMSAEAVFDTDLAALDSADAVIAHIGLPSTGVGAELAIAAASGRRILGLKRPGEPSSRFAEGLLLEAGSTVTTFQSASELDGIVQQWLNRPRSWFGRPATLRFKQRAIA